MKVFVAYWTDVDDDYRRAIRLHYGKTGYATRAEVLAWLERYGSSEDDNLMAALDEEKSA